MKYRLFALLLAAAVLVTPSQPGAAQEFPYQIFERYLEPLAQQIGMPGLSAVIVQGGKVAWSKGYGYADVENKVQATVDTPYPIGGITQAMTGVLVGVCLDRHLLSTIDNDIREFAPAFPFAGTSVRQVLAHAVDGRFQYNPSYYLALTPVVEQCLKRTYREATAVEILDRLGMPSSVPGLDLARPEGAAARDLFAPSVIARYETLLRNVATPYRIDSKGRATRSEYPSYGLDAASGLVSTAWDLAQFEIALDKRDGIPFSASTLDKMWSPTTFTINNVTYTTPTGLGWFTTTESGVKLVWTFGHIADASSALIVKIIPQGAAAVEPTKRVTLIMLANSGGLAQGYSLENANVTSSPFVKVFLRLFI